MDRKKSQTGLILILKFIIVIIIIITNRKIHNPNDFFIGCRGISILQILIKNHLNKLPEMIIGRKNSNIDIFSYFLVDHLNKLLVQ